MNAYAGRPVSAVKPPGRNLAPTTRPRPCRSTAKVRVTTPLTTARQYEPFSSSPVVTVRWKAGCVITSRRVGASVDQDTLQYRSTKSATVRPAGGR